MAFCVKNVGDRLVLDASHQGYACSTECSSYPQVHVLGRLFRMILGAIYLQHHRELIALYHMIVLY
jgi:hypothetical protein